MSRGPQGAAARLGSVCLGEQHPLFLGSFGTCGCPGQQWVLGLPPGRAFWGGPCLLPAHPRMRVQVQGQVGRWQWSSCVGVGAALEDLGKSTNALAF